LCDNIDACVVSNTKSISDIFEYTDNRSDDLNTSVPILIWFLIACFLCSVDMILSSTDMSICNTSFSVVFMWSIIGKLSVLRYGTVTTSCAIANNTCCISVSINDIGTLNNLA
jgi:hypothetical protein